MVETSHRVGEWPPLYEPVRGLVETVTHFKRNLPVLIAPKGGPPKGRVRRLEICG